MFYALNRFMCLIIISFKDLQCTAAGAVSVPPRGIQEVKILHQGKGKIRNFKSSIILKMGQGESKCMCPECGFVLRVCMHIALGWILGALCMHLWSASLEMCSYVSLFILCFKRLTLFVEYARVGTLQLPPIDICVVMIP